MTADVDERHRTQLLWWAAAVCLVASVLLWTLWVLPTHRSVADAPVTDTGAAMTIEAQRLERVGVWTDSAARHLGTFGCVADGPGDVTSWRGPSLAWEDTLWWMTGRFGYSQFAQLTFHEAGTYTVRCADERRVYDGGVVLAADTFGSTNIGLGSQGASGFAIGSVLAVTAVGLPLFVALLPLVLLLRALIGPRRQASGEGGRRS